VSGVAHLAGAFALVLAIALLCVRRTGTAVFVCAVQALLAAAALGASDWHVAIIALLAFALNGLALPLTLRRILRRPGMSPIANLRGRGVVSWLAALVLVAVSAAIFTQIRTAEPGEALVLGSSIVLVAQRSHPLAPALGLLSSQNGLLLVASATPGLPLLALMVVVVPFVPALVLANAWLRQ
jgi:hypothetical protein